MLAAEGPEGLGGGAWRFPFPSYFPSRILATESGLRKNSTFATQPVDPPPRQNELACIRVRAAFQLSLKYFSDARVLKAAFRFLDHSAIFENGWPSSFQALRNEDSSAARSASADIYVFFPSFSSFSSILVGWQSAASRLLVGWQSAITSSQPISSKRFIAALNVSGLPRTMRAIIRLSIGWQLPVSRVPRG